MLDLLILLQCCCRGREASAGTTQTASAFAPSSAGCRRQTAEPCCSFAIPCGCSALLDAFLLTWFAFHSNLECFLISFRCIENIQRFIGVWANK
ncbi:uncharacterized protein LOC100277711 [Zea mays]|uniref:uncharacterized protein LOC100277711 n=1 Tax=Zea mays TaxID=4577 RepID=UPI0002207423|nr:uncharacterized protein LOC100277711 [Zea mays]